jgi:hypothetical protein
VTNQKNGKWKISADLLRHFPFFICHFSSAIRREGSSLPGSIGA